MGERENKYNQEKLKIALLIRTGLLSACFFLVANLLWDKVAGRIGGGDGVV